MTEPPLTETPAGDQADTDKSVGTGTEDLKKTAPTSTKSTAGSRPGSNKSQRSARSGSGKGGMGDVPPPIRDLVENPAADLRNMRRIIAEDPEWSLATVPMMVELCVDHIVSNFKTNSSILNDLMPKHKAKVLEQISTTLPLRVTANLVEYEGYWKRCCHANWETCDVSAHNNSWKQMFFERNLQRLIEHFVPEVTDPTELNETVALSANYVQNLDIRQLLPPVKEAPKVNHEEDFSDGAESESGDGPEVDHFDFFNVLPKLPFLKSFHVTFGVRDCGMNFEWNLFQFTARDCLMLAKCIGGLKHLQTLHLHRSKVDDDKIRVLISHMLDHPGLTELDVSHNLISDRGARAVGKFLNNHSQLVKLNVSDNNIRAAGAQAIAHALTKNTTLKCLNLRLNRLGDEGGQAICRALLKNTTLTDVNLGSNDLTEPTAAVLSQVVAQNTVLRILDLSCNRIGPDGGKQLQEGMAENDVITALDLRLTECGKEAEYCVNRILSNNREKAREKGLREDSANE